MASDKSGHLVGRRDGNTKKFHKFAAFKKINNTKWELDGAKSHLRDRGISCDRGDDNTKL
jgi:hypothetical protein